MRTDRKILLILFLLGGLVGLIMEFFPKEIEYTVEVTYCDARPKKVVKVKSYIFPANSDISTWRRAAPTWNDEINVCDIIVIDKK